MMKRRLVESNKPTEEATLVERNPEPLGHQLLNPYAVGKHTQSDLVALAQELEKADSYVRSTATNKLQVIVDQVRFLKSQAETILKDAQNSANLHRAACNFQKKPGHLYFLYRRPSGQEYFSMLSPEDWSGSTPHEFLGAYYLEHDMSWTPASDFSARHRDLSAINHLISSYESGSKIDNLMCIDN